MLTRIKQVAAKVESVAGTFDTAVRAAAYAGFGLRAAAFEITPQTYTSELLRETLTPEGPRVTRQDARATVTVELAGATTGITPTFDVLLRGCGMRSAPLSKLTIGSVTGGPFRHGETITQASTGATATVVLNTYTGTTTLYIADVRGEFNGTNVITGGTTGATATPSVAPASAFGANEISFVASGNKIVTSGTSWVTRGFTSGMYVDVRGSKNTGNTAAGRVSGTVTATDLPIDPTTMTIADETPASTVEIGVVDVSTGRAWWPKTFQTLRLQYTSTSHSPEVGVGDVFQGATNGATAVVQSVHAASKTITARIFNAKQIAEGEAIARVLLNDGTNDTDSLGTAEGVIYDDMPTLSLVGYNDGKRHEIKGARGNVALECVNGEPVRLNFTLTGGWNATTDSANLQGVSRPNRTSPLFLAVGLALRVEGASTTYAPRIRSANLDLGHDVQYRESANEATGILEASIVGRAGSGSFDPEGDLETAHPFFGAMVASTPVEMNFQVGSTNGNKFLAQCPGLVYSGIREGDRNGHLTNEVTLALTGGTMTNASGTAGSDNDMVLVYVCA